MLRIQLAFLLILSVTTLRTPGIARALRALNRAKKRNAAAARRGHSVTIGGKTIKASTYKRKYGLPKRSG